MELKLQNDNLKGYVDKWRRLLFDLGDINHEAINYVTKGNLFWNQVKHATVMKFNTMLYADEILRNGTQPDLNQLWSTAKAVIKQREVDRNAQEYYKSLHQGNSTVASGI